MTLTVTQATTERLVTSLVSTDKHDPLTLYGNYTHTVSFCCHPPPASPLTCSRKQKLKMEHYGLALKYCKTGNFAGYIQKSVILNLVIQND